MRTGVRGWSLVSQGTVATTVINAAINALPNGGLVFIGAGTYNITTPIIISITGIAVKGAGRWGTILTTAAAIDIIQFVGATNAYVTLRDFSISGADIATCGIHGLAGSQMGDFYMDHLLINHINGHGFWMQADQASDPSINILACQFEVCHNVTNTGVAIFLDPQVGAQQFYITECMIWNQVDIGIQIGSAGFKVYKVHIFCCQVFGTQQGIKIVSAGASEIYVQENDITGNVNAILVTSTMSTFFIMDNTISNSVGQEVIIGTNGITPFYLINNDIIHLPSANNTYNCIWVRSDSAARIIGNKILSAGVNQSSNLISLVGSDAIIAHNYFDGSRAYQITLSSGATRNLIADNIHRNIGTSAVDTRNGTGAGNNEQRFDATQVPFTVGGDATGIPILTQFITADASAKGWEVNAADEWVIATLQLPQELQQIIWIKIWGVALGAPIGAGGQMHIAIIANAGASDAPFTTEPVSLVDRDSVTTNYVANDVMYWRISPDNDTDILHMLGGYSLEVKVKYNAGADPDGATNAVFRAVEVEYV